MALELHDRFHAMKTYGKEPESLESIIKVFLRDLAAYPLDKIMLAIRTHSQRSQEFPTVADIAGLIRRGGRPPLSESQYIAISKKDGEDRTPEEWQYLRDYQAERDRGWEDEPDEHKTSSLLAENTRLRAELMQLRDEYQRLSEMLRQERMSKGIEKPKPALEDKVARTIAVMREAGASDDDIAEFRASCSLPAEAA